MGRVLENDSDGTHFWNTVLGMLMFIMVLQRNKNRYFNSIFNVNVGRVFTLLGNLVGRGKYVLCSSVTIKIEHHNIKVRKVFLKSNV